MSETLHLHSASVEDTQRLGERLGAALPAGSVVVLTGDLGAGKTQLTKGIARALGVQEPITSPTFNLMLVYDTAAAKGEQASIIASDKAAAATACTLLQHLDLYRLDSAEQLEDIDYYGSLQREDAISVVEWGDKFPEALPDDYLLVALSGTATGDTRTLDLTAYGPRSEAALQRLRAE
jgi:tRNA threonylcarbamoyladenosine biosynthesis protein TsaE